MIAPLLTFLQAFQDPDGPIGPPVPDGFQGLDPLDPSTQAATQGPGIDIRLSSGSLEPDAIGGALEIVLLMTVLSLAPAIVMTMTSFTRIVIVLSFLRRAMSIQELPPTMVVTGFAAFLSLFVMAPVFDDVRNEAYEPYVEKQIDLEEAMDRAGGRMNTFMLDQIYEEDLQLIVDLAGDRVDVDLSQRIDPDEIPFHVVVPAFVLSEIKTAFQMGFVLFLPFLVIDLVISAILISMGMFTLPPVVVSTPLKILLFVLVDGWNLVVESLALSFTEL